MSAASRLYFAYPVGADRRQLIFEITTDADGDHRISATRWRDLGNGLQQEGGAIEARAGKALTALVDRVQHALAAQS